MNTVFVQAAFYHLLAYFFQGRTGFRLSLESLFLPVRTFLMQSVGSEQDADGEGVCMGQAADATG